MIDVGGWVGCALRYTVRVSLHLGLINNLYRGYPHFNELFSVYYIIIVGEPTINVQPEPTT